MVVDRATAFRVLLLAAAAAGLWPAAPARAEQSFRRAGVDFNAVRPVEIPAERSYAVVVTMFFHHGEIRPDGKNVVVSARNRTLVPMRVLQVGPGDFCRLAFQPIQGQKEYEIFYGGPAAAEPLPPWTSRDGLLLETRRYSECDLGKFEAVRRGVRGGRADRGGLCPRSSLRLQPRVAGPGAVLQPLQRLAANRPPRTPTDGSPPARIAASC